MSHHKTWERWLRMLSPAAALRLEVPDNVHDSFIRSMAEALALAAPSGPRSIPCEDDCHCGSPMRVVQLHEELMEEGFDAKGKQNSTLEFADMLQRAMAKDGMRGLERHELHLLARWRVIVSDHNAAVAAVRAKYPSTWAAIKENIK